MGEVNLEEEYNNFEKTILRASSLNFTNKDFIPLLYNIYHKGSKEDIIRTVNTADENSLFERDNFNNCLIHFVAEFGNKESFEIIFNKLSDAFIDDQNKIGETPLILAAKAGNKDIVQFLIDKGANINKKDVYGLNPISIAATNGRTEIVELLFKKSLEKNKEEIVNEPTTDNQNRAPRNNSNNKKVMEPTNSNTNNSPRKKINVKKHEETPTTKEETPTTKKETTTNYIDMPDEFGFTPLENAISNGHLETVKKLIELGAKINEDDLYYAVSNGQAEVAEYLNSTKAFEHNQKLEDYAIEAIKNGETDILKFLVENKYSNPNKRDLNNKTLLDYSIENKKEEMVEFLNKKTKLEFKKDRITNTNIIHNATKKANQKTLKTLAKNNGKKNKYIKKFFKGRDDNGNIPLYYAVKNKDAEMAEFVIEEMNSKDLIDKKNFSDIIDVLYSDENKQFRKEIFNNLNEEIVNKIKEIKMGIEIEKFNEEGLMREKEHKALVYDFKNGKQNVKGKIRQITQKREEIVKAKKKLELLHGSELSQNSKNKIEEIEKKLKKYKIDIIDKSETSELETEQITRSKSQTLTNTTTKNATIIVPRSKTPNSTRITQNKVVQARKQQQNRYYGIRKQIDDNPDKILTDLKSINEALDEIMNATKSEVERY